MPLAKTPLTMNQSSASIIRPVAVVPRTILDFCRLFFPNELDRRGSKISSPGACRAGHLDDRMRITCGEKIGCCRAVVDGVWWRADVRANHSILLRTAGRRAAAALAMQSIWVRTEKVGRGRVRQPTYHRPTRARRTRRPPWVPRRGQYFW